MNSRVKGKHTINSRVKTTMNSRVKGIVGLRLHIEQAALCCLLCMRP
jgi:hypothetical protein